MEAATVPSTRMAKAPNAAVDAAAALVSAAFFAA